jgi:hypothetical protein
VTGSDKKTDAEVKGFGEVLNSLITITEDLFWLPPRDSNPDMLIQSPITDSENEPNAVTPSADSGKVLQNPTTCAPRKRMKIELKAETISILSGVIDRMVERSLFRLTSAKRENLGRADAKAMFAGQEPAVSPDGEWFAYIKEESGHSAAWLARSNFADPPKMVLPASVQPLELVVNSDGDLIASAGNVSDSHLILAISPDGRSKRTKARKIVVIH